MANFPVFFRSIRTLALLTLLDLNYKSTLRNGFASAQSTSRTTTALTETFVEIHIIVSTVVENISSCPCPSSTLGQNVDLATTATFLGAPTESAVVVELYFTLPVQDASTITSTSPAGAAASTQGSAQTVSYLMNRNDDQAVVDSIPLALYLGSDGSLSQASDISQRLYFSLPAGITGRDLRKRFDELLPVSIGDNTEDVVFSGFVEGNDGFLYFNLTTNEGTLTLGFTICPGEGSEASAVGERIYMYDTAAEPALSGCFPGSAKRIPYIEFAEGSISGFLPPTGDGVSPGVTTATGAGGDSGSTQTIITTDGGFGTKPTSGAGGFWNGGGTITNGPTTGTGGDTIPTDKSRSHWGPGTDTNNSHHPPGDPSNGGNGGHGGGGGGGGHSGGGPAGSPGGGGPGGQGGPGGGGGGWSGGNNVGFRTERIYTTAATSVSRTYNDAGRVYTEYIPYPSSVKIVKKLHGEEAAKNVAAYLGKFLDLPSGLPSTPERAVEYYRLFELDVHGHLCVPITGPHIVGGTWDGSADLSHFQDLKCAYSLPGNNANYVGNIFKLATLGEGEKEGGKLLKFNKVPNTNVLTLDSSANVTAGYGLWICDRDFSLLGITNGAAPGCNYDRITEMIIWGNQVTFQRGNVYGFVAAVETQTVSIGEGPSIVIQTVHPKSIITQTQTITDPTAGGYGRVTIGTGLDAPSATVEVTQALRKIYNPYAWSLTGTAYKTLQTVRAAGPTMYEEIDKAPEHSFMFKMFYHTPWEATNTRYIPLTVSDDVYLNYDPMG
ncbi:hypothetical protein TWF718_006435 [Orbilia javanica]|uniref:Uncharacterized protein n=1 Tax=Orbilia javanica TaxID=47235 RepID=A0AAN8MWA9_9PEZI